MFLLSLDEIDRVKRMRGLRTVQDLEDATGVTRKTWTVALKGREPKPAVLNALAQLGARPSRILISDEPATNLTAA